MLKKQDYISDIGQELWQKYFGFLEDRPRRPEAPSIIPRRKEPRTRNEEPEKKQVLDEISSQFSELLEEKVRTADARLTTEDCSLHDIVQYFRHSGVVGEEDLAVATTLALVNKTSFGVEGYSGSGKTFITDKLISLVQDKVYTTGQSSKLAIFNAMDEINESEIIYIPELQKAMRDKSSPIIEVIKDLTEGKDATRIVTKKTRDGVDEYVIKSGITIVYTLALENYFKKDEESSRRLIRFRTDSTPEHLQAIHDNKAQRRHTIGIPESIRENLADKVRNHIYECMALDVQVIDPFADYIAELVPNTQKSVGYIDHYYALLDASAKFNANDRVQVTIDGQRYLLIELEDHVTVYGAYFKEFIHTLKEFSERAEDEDELQSFDQMLDPNWTECYRKGVAVMQSDPTLAVLSDVHKTKWVGNQEKEGKILGLDYKTGEKIAIAQL